MSALAEAVLAQMRDGALPVAEERHRAAVGKRAPQVGIGGDDPVSVPLQLQLADHQLVEQADHVRAGADQVARVGKRLLERAGAAQPLACARAPAPSGRHRARYAAAVSPLCPPPTTIASQSRAASSSSGVGQPDPARARR